MPAAHDPARDPTDPRSHASVDTATPQRLADWARELGVTEDALAAAVQAVGPRVDRIKDYLTGGQAGKQSGG
jgi:hypothetical protein